MAPRSKKNSNELSSVSFNIKAQEGKQQMAMDNKSDLLIYGGAAGCVDHLTQFMSPSGWKYISEWKKEDKVLQVNPKNRKLSFCEPYYIEEKDHNDIFYSIRNAKGIEQVLTMTHRFVFYKKRKSKKNFEILVGDLVSLQQVGKPLRGWVDNGQGSRIPFNILGKEDTYLKIYEEQPINSTKYCFETDTGFLLLKRGNHTFVTGNSGKSRLLLLKALKYTYNDPDFMGVMFRKTTGAHKAAGGLFTEAKKLFSPMRPHVREQAMEIEFTNTGGGSLKFSHLEHESTAETNWQGTQLGLCCFDELTHFYQTDLLYLIGRLRSESSTPSFCMATCNPDGDSWVLNWVLPYLDEKGFPREDMCGKEKFFIIHEDSPIFADSAEELEEKYPDLCNQFNPNTGENVHVPPKTYTFINGTIFDNPALIRLNPNYLASLKAQTRINRDRLLSGNWFAREQNSTYFSRDWLNKITYDKIPANMKYVRAWDKAAKVPSEKNRYPDYTTSIKIGKDRNGNIYILGDFDCDAHDEGSNITGRFRRLPGERDQLIEMQAHVDGNEVVVILPKDPSGAGIVEYQESAKKLIAKGFRVKSDPMPSNKSKLTRFYPFSSACQNGFVYIVEDSFPNRETLEHFYKELEVFNGEKSTATIHDDIPDACASGFNAIQQEKVYEAVSIPTPSSNSGGRNPLANSGLSFRSRPSFRRR